MIFEFKIRKNLIEFHKAEREEERHKGNILGVNAEKKEVCHDLRISVCPDPIFRDIYNCKNCPRLEGVNCLTCSKQIDIINRASGEYQEMMQNLLQVNPLQTMRNICPDWKKCKR